MLHYLEHTFSKFHLKQTNGSCFTDNKTEEGSKSKSAKSVPLNNSFRVKKNHPPPRDRQDLLQMLQLEWQRIRQRLIRTLVNSMRSRCVKCLNNGDGHTNCYNELFNGTDFANFDFDPSSVLLSVKQEPIVCFK